MKSERPKKEIEKKKTLNFRINRIKANLFNFFNRKGLDYRALDVDESLQMLLETGKSYIRFGNGESEILSGLDMSTQVYDKNLERGLVKVIEGYSAESNYLLGLTNWCLTQSIEELKQAPSGNLYLIWRFMRYMFYRLDMHRIKMPFLEADMFRIAPVGLPTERIELLWAEKSSIIMVYNNGNSYQRFKKKHSDKEIYFVEISDKNFFDMLPETEGKILSIIKDNGIRTGDLAVLVAAGPGSNVLCYNLCQRDDAILCYDMGNFFYMRYSGALQGAKGNREKGK
jgi:hypothetical protein